MSNLAPNKGVYTIGLAPKLIFSIERFLTIVDYTPSNVLSGLNNTHAYTEFNYYIDFNWFSLIEQKYYSAKQVVQSEKFEVINNLTLKKECLFYKVIVGMTPYGGLAIWLYHKQVASLLLWTHGKELVQDSLNDFYGDYAESYKKTCSYFVDSASKSIDLYNTVGLPPRDLFDNYMKQFTYRYLPLFEHWDEEEGKWQKYTEEGQETKPELDYIEEALYDGTHDKLHDGGLMQYHEAGKPKKLAIKWHIKKSEYTAYFWFEDEAVRAIFDRFYGIHPDTKTDFILHIDPMKNQYQLALFRYGLKEPQVIPEETYQLIVFKNKFEHFRSKNYNQPRGAWIW